MKRKLSDAIAGAFPGILFLIVIAQFIIIAMRLTGAIHWPWLVTFLPIILMTLGFTVAVVCSVVLAKRADIYITRMLDDEEDFLP